MEKNTASAWTRLWARLIDTILYAYAIIPIVFIAFPPLLAGSSITAPDPGGMLFLILLFVPIIMLVDAIIIAQFGTTIGKWIVGTYVATTDHSNLTTLAAIKRNFDLYVRGLVLGLPIISLLGYFYAYYSIKKWGITPWDRSSDSRVYDRRCSQMRTALAAVIAIALQIINIIGSFVPDLVKSIISFLAKALEIF